VSEKLKSALDILKELESKAKASELKIKTKEIDVILIDYREQLKRYDVFALGFDYVLYFNKNNEAYKDKLEKIIEALEHMRPVRAKLLVKVDQIPTPAMNKEQRVEMVESITGDVVDVKEFEVIESVVSVPIFVDRGVVALTRTGNAKIRCDGTVYVVNDTTRNGERIKVLAQVGNVEVLFSYARSRNSGGYKVIEGIYFLPLEDVRKMIEENKAVAAAQSEQKPAEQQKLEQSQQAGQSSGQSADSGQSQEEKLELTLR